MQRIKILVAALIMLLITGMIGCSGGGSDVTEPQNPVTPQKSAAQGNTSTGLWGTWQVSIDKATGEFGLTQLRQADLALNVLWFLEPPALVNMNIDWATLNIDFPGNYIGVDVILTHPFIAEGTFTGFDVRGICIGPWLSNADGLTKYFNPNDFTGTPFGYIDGLLGAPDSAANYSAEYSGYKYFADGIALDEPVATYFATPANLANRGRFSEGASIKRHYDLHFGTPNTAFLVFNYAIYASYNWPTGSAPFDLSAFDITTANQAEPIFADVTENSNSLYYNDLMSSGGGAINMDITIFDWLKSTTPPTVEVSAPGVMSATPATFVSDDDANRRTYNVNAIGSPTTSADLDIFISVTSDDTYGQNYFLDLMPISHPLYDQPIVVKFLHKATIGVSTGLFEDPMDSTTAPDWTIEHGAHYPSPACDWAQVGSEWQSNNGTGITGTYQNNMDTYLVSKMITAPADGNFYMYITHRFNTESPGWMWDHCNVMYRLQGTSTWLQFDPAAYHMYGQSAGWTSWLLQRFGVTMAGGANFQLGFYFHTDSSVYSYNGWFIDHVILSETLNSSPTVGPVTGLAGVGTFGVQQYSVTANDPEGNNMTYAWETGDDAPPAYDDGPGNGDGTIGINWQTNGNYVVDVKVTDDGAPSLFSTSSAPLAVNVFKVPVNTGPSENFDAWPPSGWTFVDHTTAMTGQFWGQTNAQSVNCLDADGADDSCYGLNLFEEARWNNVVVPAATNAVLRITHTIWSEGYPTYFYDGGMLFLDDNIVYSSDCLSGLANDRYHSSSTYWTPNDYMPVWPGTSAYIGWADKYPDSATWLNGFSTSVMDISSIADGGVHDISLVFHADSSVSCATGSDYHTWLIDKVEILYE